MRQFLPAQADVSCRSRMKRLTVVALVLAMAVLAVSCASSPAADSSSLPASAAAVTEEPEAAATASADGAADTASASEAAAEQTQTEDASSEPAAASSDLVVFFSWSGNTRGVAEEIVSQTGADVFEIVPETAYPDDYDETVDIALEEKRAGERPAFQGTAPDLTAYDRVFVGFPNWWGDMPMVMYTFFDSTDLAGKTIAPFVTSSSSGFSGTQEAMASLEPEAELTEGLALRVSELDGTQEAVSAWLEQIG